jgi:hypothetical protein
VVLTHGQETTSAPADQGGTGKTQIAVAFSGALRGARSVDAIAARARLASAYRRGGKPKDAIALYQRTLAECERFLGPDHPLTRTVRDSLEAVARSGTRRP